MCCVIVLWLTFSGQIYTFAHITNISPIIEGFRGNTFKIFYCLQFVRIFLIFHLDDIIQSGLYTPNFKYELYSLVYKHLISNMNYTVWFISTWFQTRITFACLACMKTGNYYNVFINLFYYYHMSNLQQYQPIMMYQHTASLMLHTQPHHDSAIFNCNYKYVSMYNHITYGSK